MISKTSKYVAIIGSKGFPSLTDAGGVEQGVMEVSVRLVERGYSPIVYERGKQFNATEYKGVKLQTVPYFNSQNLAGWSHAFLSFFHAFFQVKDVAVWHIHCAQNGFICLLARLTGRRVVFHLHGREWRARKWNWLMRYLIRINCIVGVISSHSALAVCHTSMDDLNKWLPFHRKKIHFVPNGIPEKPEGNNQNNKIASSTDRRPFFLYAGRLVPQKNLETLLKAFSLLPYDISLVIAGGASYCSSYISLIQTESASDDRIYFTGRLDRQDLWELYETCMALVLPSEAEGCSNVLLEGLAAGCCIVASDILENKQVLGNAALYFETNNVESLNSVLQNIYEQSATLSEYRTAASIRGNQLPSWHVVTDHILKFYEA